MATDKASLEAKLQQWNQQQKKASVQFILLSAAGILTFLLIDRKSVV